MTKVDLFNTAPFGEGEELKIKYSFADIARYTTKPIADVGVSVLEHLKLIEFILGKMEEKGGWKYKGDTISIETTKTTAKIIYDDYYFTIKYKDIFNLAETEVNKLYHLGILEV